MLSAIFDGLSTLVDIVVSLVSFVGYLIEGLVEFIAGLLTAPAYIADLLGSGVFPPILAGGLLAVVTTIIILRVANRD